MHDDAGYIERWIEAVQPRSGDGGSTDGSGDSDLSLKHVPQSGVAPSHSFGDGGVDDDKDSPACR